MLIYKTCWIGKYPYTVSIFQYDWLDDGTDAKQTLTVLPDIHGLSLQVEGSRLYVFFFPCLRDDTVKLFTS